ncbi:MAG: mechanosensitive ion channel [gamma proteobacterium symbiont of Taylorina sp.]|nr:mechanosensitive ion channel [gamma proteobacterium symbiont of Taylorina sp.]
MMKFNFTLFYCVLSVFFISNQAFSEGLGLVKEKTVQEQIKSVENDKTLDEELKNSLLKLYVKTIEYLDAIKKQDQQSEIYIHAKKQAPKDIKQLEQQILKQEQQLERKKQSEQKKKQGAKKEVSLADLEQLLNSESANLAAVQATNSDMLQRLNNEIESIAEIRKRLIEAKHVLDQLLQDKKLSPASESEEYNKAGLWLLETHIAVVRSEIKMLDQQLLSQPLRTKRLKLNVELSDYNLKKITMRVQLLEQEVDLKRSIEIKKTEELTRKEQSKAKGKHQLIQTFASHNTQLSEAISIKTQELGQLESNDDEVIKETKRLITEMGNTRKKLEIAGLSQILGQMLLEQKNKLPDSHFYKKNLKKRENKIAMTGLQHIQYQEELSLIKDKNVYLSRLMSDLPADVQGKITEDLKALINTRKHLLQKAISTDESYLRAINEVDFVEKKLIIVADEYSALLDKHLFWLRNAPLIGIDDIKNLPQQMVLFLSPSKWTASLNDLFQLIRSSIWIILSLILFIVFLFKIPKLKELIVKMGKKTIKIRTDSLRHTLKAIFYTLLLAAPLPAILFLLGWQLSQIIEISEPSRSLSVGIKIIVWPLFYLLFIRFLCLEGGVAEVHFNWSERLIAGIRKEMRRLMFTLLPMLFITAVLISKSESAINSGLGRLSLLLTLLTLAVFFYRVFRPGTGYIQTLVQYNQDGFFSSYQVLWFILILASVINLMGLTIVGYVYTAGQMAVSLMHSMWFVWGLVILQQLAVRWLLLTQRKYALQQAYEKRKAYQQNQQMVQDAGDLENKEQIIDFEEPEIDLVSLSEESTQLLNMVLFITGIIGLSSIWIDVLPALGIFEQVTLWHHQGVVDGVEKLLPITLGDLALAILIAIVSIVAAKRLPAIIEILLLQNTRVSSGDRYTITTLINYTIVGTGFFSVFNILGADWARFQWLFAALSVGIGFGLQEIVANFISGIIILFERPIRVGDYVSVGDNEGVVTRIKIRATTILTRDRKELLVPNKEFITEQLLNWSLSDTTARLKIPVGVAYGSDIPRAKEILLQIAQENERVLDDPMPRIIFYNFGDNTLDLQLRCFIAHVDFRLQTISEINEAINEKFDEAGINIAFPQRDVHLDIKQPIDIHLKRE